MTEAPLICLIFVISVLVMEGILQRDQTRREPERRGPSPEPESSTTSASDLLSLAQAIRAEPPNDLPRIEPETQQEPKPATAERRV